MVFPWLFRGFFVAFICVEKQCLGIFRGFPWFFRGFSVAFSWLFRGPRFGQILRVLALEKSSELNFPANEPPGSLETIFRIESKLAFLVATALASYRIEKPRNPKNWRKIGKKIGVFYFLPSFLLFFPKCSYFFSYFSSYFLEFGVFLLCSWPTQSQPFSLFLS